LKIHLLGCWKISAFAFNAERYASKLLKNSQSIFQYWKSLMEIGALRKVVEHKPKCCICERRLRNKDKSYSQFRLCLNWFKKSKPIGKRCIKSLNCITERNCNVPEAVSLCSQLQFLDHLAFKPKLWVE
jgi:hypothetical protein